MSNVRPLKSKDMSIHPPSSRVASLRSGLLSQSVACASRTFIGHIVVRAPRGLNSRGLVGAARRENGQAVARRRSAEAKDSVAVKGLRVSSYAPKMHFKTWRWVGLLPQRPNHSFKRTHASRLRRLSRSA